MLHKDSPPSTAEPIRSGVILKKILFIILRLSVFTYHQRYLPTIMRQGEMLYLSNVGSFWNIFGEKTSLALTLLTQTHILHIILRHPILMQHSLY